MHVVCGTTITILDIIHCPASYLKQGVSETVFCFCRQEEPTDLGLVDRASICLRIRRQVLAEYGQCA
jgi:hypothetical protein